MLVGGIDEAGYGPLLGPMVVSAVAFRAQGGENDVARALHTTSRPADAVIVADSKSLHSGRFGLRRLEENTLPFLDVVPDDAASYMTQVGCDPAASSTYPWYNAGGLRLPMEADADKIRRRAVALRQGLARYGVELLLARVRVIHVEEFNRMTRSADSKSVPLADAALVLMRMIRRVGRGEHISLTVDRHGGRKRYGALLRSVFRDTNVRTLQETATCSRYALDGGRMEISFVTRAESCSTAAALASMFAKYTRELFMRMFNEWWAQRVPGLRPTAGYVTDARRFLKEIEHIIESECIPREILVRCR